MAAMVPCSHCKQPLENGAAYCPRCFLAVRWQGDRALPWIPEVPIGHPIMRLDLRHERPPGMKEGDLDLDNGVKMRSHPSGLHFEVPAGKAFESSIPFLRRRDQIARASFVALDPSTIFQVVVRRDNAGEASTQVGLSVCSGDRKARILRMTSGPKLSKATSLSEWTAHPGIGPVGQPTDIELRAFGPTLEAWIGGQLLARLHEPRLGVGWPGVRIEARGAPARAIWLGFEAREVIL